MSSRTVLPPETLTWLASWPGVRGLTLSGRELPRLLKDAGHQVFALTQDVAEAQTLAQDAGVEPIVGAAESLPIDPCQFDVVFCHQAFHRLEVDAALAEIARVLRPGGCFSVSYIVRDDSVPWVRRLAALLRHYDPMAMAGDYGQDSLSALHDSKYFPEVEERAFRIWRPFGMPELEAMVTRQNFIQRLDTNQRDALLGQVRQLYESSVRPGENLRLPFQVTCARGWVSHDELTANMERAESALNIYM